MLVFEDGFSPHEPGRTRLTDRFNSPDRIFTYNKRRDSELVYCTPSGSPKVDPDGLYYSGTALHKIPFGSPTGRITASFWACFSIRLDVTPLAAGRSIGIFGQMIGNSVNGQAIYINCEQLSTYQGRFRFFIQTSGTSVSLAAHPSTHEVKTGYQTIIVRYLDGSYADIAIKDSGGVFKNSTSSASGNVSYTAGIYEYLMIGDSVQSGLYGMTGTYLNAHISRGTLSDVERDLLLADSSYLFDRDDWYFPESAAAGGPPTLVSLVASAITTTGATLTVN